MLIFLSFIAIVSTEAAVNSTDGNCQDNACNCLSRSTIPREQFDPALNAQGIVIEPYNWLCYIPGPDCTAFMIKHSLQGALFITSAHCLDGRTTEFPSADNVICPVYGNIKILTSTFSYHPEYLKLVNLGLNLVSHDYDLAAFTDFSFGQTIGFTINNPGLKPADLQIMGFTEVENRDDIRLAPISDVKYEERRHITFHTNAQWGDCVATGSPITGQINGVYNVIAVNQDDVVYTAGDLKRTCYEYSADCNRGGDGGGDGDGGYPYPPYQYELEKNSEDAGSKYYGGDGECPTIERCEFFGSQVDNKLIEWQGEGDGFGWGDPHFTTLDNQVFHVYNQCQYYLTRIGSLDITGQFAKISWRVPQIKAMAITYANFNRVVLSQDGKYKFYAGRFLNFVDPKRYKLPLTAKYLTITKSGNSFIVRAANGVTVTWGAAGYNTEHRWDMDVPNSLKGQLVGLLGNFNGVKTDDCRLISGQLTPCPQPYDVPTNNTFLDSWQVQNTGCSGNEAPFNFEEDSSESSSFATYKEGQAACSIINDPPFNDCFEPSVRSEYIATCAEDVSASLDAETSVQSICDTLQVVAQECRNYVPDVINFRKVVAQCPEPSCPTGQEFNPCVIPCYTECSIYQRLKVREKCGTTCIGSCVCSGEDEIFSAALNKCIKISACT